MCFPLVCKCWKAFALLSYMVRFHPASLYPFDFFFELSQILPGYVLCFMLPFPYEDMPMAINRDFAMPSVKVVIPEFVF